MTRQEYWQENNPLARRAHNLVSSAIRRGKLERQNCRKCGKRAEAHHEDYSRPLDVIWLCRQCHKELHQLEGVCPGGK